MPKRFFNRLKFELERFILYRPLHQLLVIMAIIGLISVLGGIMVWVGTNDFADLGDAIWWSFLRLTDPGYIGDDHGGFKRTVSTVVSVIGYVLFLGALVAVMTQGLHQAIAKLQRGLTPIAENGHILVLGWTYRTPYIVQQLLLSEPRVRSMLKRLGSYGLHIVIQAEEVRPEMLTDLRSLLGDRYSARKITLRSGTPLQIAHLERVDFIHAAVIILPAGDFGPDNHAFPDGRTVKALLSMQTFARQNHPDEKLPLMVAELHDFRKASIAQTAYGGDIETLESDLFVARLIAQNVRTPGLSHIYSELLTNEIGNEIYLRSYERLVGRPMRDLFGLFNNAIVLGLYRREEGNEIRFHSVNLVADEVIRPGDQIVFIAANSAACEIDFDELAPPPNDLEIAPPVPLRALTGTRRVLLLGWNHQAPALIEAFAGYGDERYEIDNVSIIEPERRARDLGRRGVDYAVNNLELRFIEGEFTSIVDLQDIDLPSYDNIIILSSDWVESGAESDARAVLGFLLLEKLLEGAERMPHILVQLINATNATLFPEDRCEVVTTPVVLSHLLTQIALQRALRGVFDELFGPAGAEIFFRPVEEYGMAGKDVSFREMQIEAFRHGEIAIGLRIASQRHDNGGIVLNPPKSERRIVELGDEVVVLQDR